MFVMPFSNPNAQSNPNPNLNSESNSNPGVNPSFGIEESNRVEGAGVEVTEQPLPRLDRDYGNGLSMGRRKKYSPLNPNSNGKTEFCCWTTAMDDVLIDAFVRQESLGNRASTGTFTSQAYDNIMRELRDKFRDRPLDKERIKNRIKYIKKNFAPCYDIFKNGLEGFSWNPATKLWTAEPDDWDRLIEVHPEAIEWMSKPVPHYDKLSLLYRPDREAEYLEKRRRDNSIGENQTEGAEVMEGVTFEGHDGLNQLEGESCSSKKRARKVNKDEANAMILREGLDKIAEAIAKSTAELVKSRQRLPIPEGQMWDLLVELGFEESIISTVYIFLIERPHMVGALLGCPPHRRKDVLIQMAFGASTSIPPPK